jgi:hybrid cluster-associated redox disulfide protein
VYSAERFTANMLIRDVLTGHPGASAVFERHGLRCANCIASGSERLSDIAGMHDVPLDRLVAELNALEPVATGKDME